MMYLYIGLLLLTSGINNYLLTYDQIGQLPYHFGYIRFAQIGHVCTLACSLFYLGWGWGLVVFACYLFNLFDICITWTFRALFGKMDKPYSRTIYGSFSFIIYAYLIFTVCSFFFADNGILKEEVEQSDYHWGMIIFSICFLGFLARLLWMRTIKKKYHLN